MSNETQTPSQVWNSMMDDLHEQEQCYIVSIKHTSKGDAALTFWCANRAGYTYDKIRAGVYSEAELTGICDELNVAVPKDKVDKLWMTANDFNDKYLSVPNNKTTLKILGLSSNLMKPKKFASCRMKFITDTHFNTSIF